MRSIGIRRRQKARYDENLPIIIIKFLVVFINSCRKRALLMYNKQSMVS
jgi:hypothetical protein